MHNLIILNVKCPHCDTSLMDKDRLIDNAPSINLRITVKGKKGGINVSAVYGSFNYSSSLTIPVDSIADISCPHCNTEIISSELCDVCGAPMIPLRLIEGGTVKLCSREGCRKHSIEFEDISVALSRLHHEYGFGEGSQTPSLTSTKVQQDISEKKEDRTIMETGSFLHSFCPHCRRSLIQGNVISFRIVRDTGEEGILMLSPYLNIFTHKSTVHLPEGTRLKDVRCIHCDTGLIEKQKACPECGAPTARFLVAAMTKLIDFHICTKKGCTWHGLSDADYHDIMLEDNKEW